LNIFTPILSLFLPDDVTTTADYSTYAVEPLYELPLASKIFFSITMINYDSGFERTVLFN